MVVFLPHSFHVASTVCNKSSVVGFSQMGDASLSESPEEEEDIESPGLNRGNFSPKAFLSEPFSSPTDDWPGSPRKRTQTLPTFNCPLTGMAAKADALNRWSRIQESEENCGTLSEDIFKLLDLRSSGSLFGGTQISKKEEENRFTSRRGSDNTSLSTVSSQKPECDPQPVQVLSHQKSVEAPTASASAQQVNNKSEEKKDSQQQLIDRWGQQRTHKAVH